MTKFPEVQWVLDMEPRDVQIEALRRSYYGYRWWDQRTDRGVVSGPQWLPRGPGPVARWGHLLEMRLGKTGTTVNEFELFRTEYGINRLIVLAPNSFKAAWGSEIEKYGIIMPTLVYETSNAQKTMGEAYRIRKEPFALIVNYESLQYEKTLSFLEDMVDKRTMIVADESIKIKNPSAITTKNAIAIAKPAAVKRILTGLPITQGPQDFYSQFRFIGALDRMNYYSFRNRFCKMGGFKGKVVIGVREDQIENLQGIISETAFIGKRKDWAKTTTPEYYTVPLTLSGVQAQHYHEMNKEMITYLTSGETVKVDLVVSKLLKLQQISSGFLYSEDKSSIELMPLDQTPKMKRLVEMLEEEVPGKVVVAYNYGFSGDALMRVLSKWNPAVIRGTQWMKKNGVNVEDEKRRFNNDPKCRVIVVQMQAGKYGHNLAGIEGDRCGHLIFYENTYSLDDRFQIEARPLGAEQDWPMVYLDFFSSQVERNVLEALIKKESLVDAVVGSYAIGDKSRVSFDERD